VLRDRLPRDVEVRGDPPRGQFLVADEMQDLASSGLSDGIDGCLHAFASIHYRNLILAQECAFILLPIIDGRSGDKDAKAHESGGPGGC